MKIYVITYLFMNHIVVERSTFDEEVHVSNVVIDAI